MSIKLDSRKVMLTVSYALLILLLTGTDAQQKCASGWTQFEDKCFYFNDTRADFHNNRYLCNLLNASMISIRSEEENNFVGKLMVPFDPAYTWLGMNTETNPFLWLDKTPVNFTNYIRQPLMSQHKQGISRCLEMTPFHKWDVHYCEIDNLQFCQKPLNESMFVQKISKGKVMGAEVDLFTIKSSRSSNFLLEMSLELILLFIVILIVLCLVFILIMLCYKLTKFSALMNRFEQS